MFKERVIKISKVQFQSLVVFNLGKSVAITFFFNFGLLMFINAFFVMFNEDVQLSGVVIESIGISIILMFSFVLGIKFEHNKKINKD